MSLKSSKNTEKSEQADIIWMFFDFGSIGANLGLGDGNSGRQTRRDYEARCEALHPSTTPQEIRAEHGLNQKSLGMPSACTYFAIAFVRKFLDKTVSSSMVTPAWVSNVMLEPGIDIPVTNIHPDPCIVVNDAKTGLCVLSSDLRSRSKDSVDLSLSDLEARITAWLSNTTTVVGVLIITGTETFGVARTSDNFVALFDSHGDSTQSQPAVVKIWNTNIRLHLTLIFLFPHHIFMFFFF